MRELSCREPPRPTWRLLGLYPSSGYPFVDGLRGDAIASGHLCGSQPVRLGSHSFSDISLPRTNETHRPQARVDPETVHVRSIV
jgi:hypothetical protein